MLQHFCVWTRATSLGEYKVPVQQRQAEGEGASAYCPYIDRSNSECFAEFMRGMMKERCTAPLTAQPCTIAKDYRSIRGSMREPRHFYNMHFTENSSPMHASNMRTRVFAPLGDRQSARQITANPP